MRPPATNTTPLVPALADGISTRRLAAASAAAVGLPLVLAALAHAPYSLGLGLVGLLDLVVVALVWRDRALLTSLPLEIAPVAVADRGVVRFRIRLGRNRPVTSTRVEIRWQSESASIPLDVDEVDGPKVGPWTVAVRPPSAGGMFVVRAVATEGSRTWEAEATIEDVREGRFGPPVTVDGGRLRWSADWDAIQPETSAGTV